MIKAEMVTKTFEDFHALDKISCRIPKGCIYGMVGSNGAGKSTFLRLLTGVYRSDGGTIRIDDEAVYNNPAVKNKIAYVPDELYFLPGATMERMGTLYDEIYPDFDKAYYRYLAECFQLNLKKSIHTFSKGMKRQAATLLAISSKPEYIFFDETFDGLDPIMRNLVKSLICKDVLERNTTVIITSHSLRELEDICDQLALLHKGGLVLESDIQYLKTSLFKIQTAFCEDRNQDSFAAVDVLHYSKKGSVINLIARGSQEEITARIKTMQPLILDILPLSLEEVFTYEMEALGYNFQNVLEGETNEE
jgi:ABC-2 type transport system ATP-binding protein